MAREILYADNFHVNNLVEQSKLNADAAVAQAGIVVENTQGYAINDYLLVGNIGSERSELKQILSISDGVIVLTGNLAIAHNKGEAVIKLRGNKIKFYRATDVDGSIPTDGSFSNIGG